VARVCAGELIGRWDPRHAVARHDGHQDGNARAGCEQPRDSCNHGLVMSQDAAQQRSPWEVDRQRLREAVQRSRRVLGRGDGEQRVRRRAAARAAAGGLRHAGRVGVDADDERLGITSGCGEHVAAVARAQIKCHAGVSRGNRSDLADVHFLELAASDDS
jgi:hypothetical protein